MGVENACAVTQGPAFRRVLPLTECSAIAVLQFLITVDNHPPAPPFHFAQGPAIYMVCAACLTRFFSLLFGLTLCLKGLFIFIHKELSCYYDFLQLPNSLSLRIKKKNYIHGCFRIPIFQSFDASKLGREQKID